MLSRCIRVHERDTEHAEGTEAFFYEDCRRRGAQSKRSNSERSYEKDRCAFSVRSVSLWPVRDQRDAMTNAIEVVNVAKVYRRYARNKQFATLKSALLKGGL